MRPGIFEQLTDVQERTAVFVRRRSVHHDASLTISKDSAEVAAEAGICGGGGKIKRGIWELAVEPFGKLL
jgi:hypothetical protein